MKKKRIVALAVVVALTATSFTAISAPSALAEEYDSFQDVESYSEDFEGYELTGETHFLEATMDDLYAGDWSVVGDNSFIERNDSNMSQQFAQVISDEGNQVLSLSSGRALGRMLDPGFETPAGSYEVSFRFKPTEGGSFDFSLNSFNESANAAKHNILYSDGSSMRMGHRQNSVNVPLTRVGTAENVWYDVKCILNNDAGYYSVELYKEGEFVARRAAINYAGNELIGFLSFSGNGSTVYVDDVSITPCEQETLIYEDNFDSYSEVRRATTYAPIASSVTEAKSWEGESFFEGYTPWRALMGLFNIAKASTVSYGDYYDLVYDDTRASQVLKLGETNNSSMILMPLDGEFLTKENQTKRGRLKISFKFRDYTNGTGLATVVDALGQYNYGNKWDYPPQFAIMEQTLGSPAVRGQPYLKTIGQPVKINQSLWYDAEIIFDVVNDNVSILVKEDSTGKEIANFTHQTNWMSPGRAPTLDRIKAINFRSLSGSATYIDDFKLEYYITKPEISGNSIVITDYKGEEVTDRKNVPVAIQSISLPFGSEMTVESTNPDTVTLTDSKGNLVNYSPEYDSGSYTIIPNGFLTPGETYTLYVSGAVTNTFGRQLGDDFDYTFKAASDYPALMTLRSASITDLEGITNGSTITAEIDYVNSSDAALGNLPFVAFYGDDMLLATQSVTFGEIAVGKMGSQTVWFTVPGASVLDMSQVDKVSICLWKGFQNSTPYCGEIDVGTTSGTNAAVDTKATDIQKPVITYSYRDSMLNIGGIANADSKYLTVQIIKPGKTFEMGGDNAMDHGDSIVFYRAQIPVTNSKYSLDVRFDKKGNTASTLEAGDYPTVIYLDDNKIYDGSVYLSSYSDFESVYDELNTAAAENDLAAFIDILNNKRAALNFNNELLGDTAVDDSIKPYFDYVKKNPLSAENEEKNAQMFDSYVVIQYLNKGKIDNVKPYIDKLLIPDDLKDLCNKVLSSDQKGQYFTGLISRKNIDTPEKLEKSIEEALILTTAKYGNGYGELKTVLETCGSEIGIQKPISAAACKAVIGNTYKDVKSFKSAYDKNKEGSGSGSSGSGSGSKPSLGSVELPISGGGTQSDPLKKTFSDIDNYEWAMIGILALADRGIINGVSEDRFDPSRNITREEFVKILVGALGLSDYPYSGNRFSDAQDGDWFTKYINIAAELGIVKGVGDGKFGVGSNITRQDMAVMLYNALKYRGVNIAADAFRFDDDAAIAPYAKEAVGALHAMGAINGMTETTFVPAGFATRAQAAKIIYSVLDSLQGK